MTHIDNLGSVFYKTLIIRHTKIRPSIESPWEKKNEMDASMNDARYNVELLYDPENETACDNIRSFLQGFGHLAPKRIEDAIGRGKIVLKRNVGYADAKSIQQRIDIEGAACKLKKRVDRKSGIEAPLKEPPLQQTVKKTVTKQIVCPKCNLRQPLHTECRRCGIIFSRIGKHALTSAGQQIKDAVPRHDIAKCKSEHKPNAFAAQTLADRHLPSLKALTTRLHRWRHNVRQWSQKPLNAMLDGAMYTVAAFVLEIVLFYLAKYVWFILAATSVGDYYRQSHPDAAMIIEKILGMGAIALSVQVILLVLIFNLMIGLVAQLTHLSRLFLDTGSFLTKLLWISSSTLTTAWITSQRDPSPSLAIAFVLTLPPTLCLLKSCLNLTRTILPELGIIISGLVKTVRNRTNIPPGIKKASQDHFDGNRQ